MDNEALKKEYEIEVPEDDFVPLEMENSELSEEKGETVEKIPSSQAEQEVKPQSESSQKDAGDDGKAVADVNLLIRAAKFGLLADDVKGFSKEQLEKVVQTLEKSAAVRPVNQAESQPEPEVGNQDKKTSGQGDSAAEYKVGLDPNEYEEALINEFNTLHSYYRQAIDDVKRQVQEIRYVIQGHVQKMAEERFDHMIASLDEGYHEILGKGKSRLLDVKSPEYQNRLKLSEAMNALASGYANMAKPVPPEEELFDMALSMVFGKEQGEKSVNKALKRREAMIINKPVERKGKPADPVARAVASVTEKLREFGAIA